MSLPHLLFLVGTTATGKSDLAVQIVEAVGQAVERSQASQRPGPEIINCDSISFFDRVQIGAAKPGPDLLARAKHHLVGSVPPPEKFTAGDFRRAALRVVERAPSRNYVVVGGSGFYSQALEKGMYDVADPSPELKAQLALEAETIGMETLYKELRARDPETKIQPADHFRTLRALEILRTTPGKTMAEIKAEFEAQKPANPFTSSKIGLFRPRDVLREKVTLRTRQMLKEGLIDEVVALRREGLRHWSPMQSVGYKEVQAYLDGDLSKEELEPLIVTSTMQVAKQQMTWFKRDPTTRWFDSDKQWKSALEAGRELLLQP